MNLLLLHPNEVMEERRVILSDRRAEHCRRILKVKPGSRLRAGVLGRGRCEAKVMAVDARNVEVRLGGLESTPRPNLEVALALPRPKVLSRMLSACASFGVDAVTLFNSWRVDKSYLDSKRLAPDRVRADLLLGLEQGMLCHVPTFRFFDRFTTFVASQRDDTNFPRVVLQPCAPHHLGHIKDLVQERVLLVFGPDGGFIARELETLQKAGVVLADLGTGPLRTETALAAALGQLALLRQQHHPSGALSSE